MGGRGVLNELVRTIIDPLALFIFENGTETHGKRIAVVQPNETPMFESHLLD